MVSAGGALTRYSKAVQDALAIGEVAGKLEDGELAVNVLFVKGALRTVREPYVVELVQLGKDAAELPRGGGCWL